MRVGNLEELKPVPATNEGTYHQVEAGYHHRRPGLLADQRRAENGDCDKAGACGPECDEDEWRSLVMEDRTVDGGGCKSRNDACTILLGVFCAFSFAAAFYALGGTRGAAAPRLLTPNGAQDEDKYASSLLVIDTAGMSTIDQSLMPLLAESPFIRSKVIDLIIDGYTAPNGVETERIDRFDNAMDAMHYLETDGEPIQVEGHPFLFVGSIGASLNHDSLRKNGITQVINLSSSAKCNTFDDIEYMCISGLRTRQQMRGRLAELDKAVELIESVRKAGGRVLSQCFYGKNRSVTLLVAYLMKYEAMSASQANNLIKKTRSQAAPYFDVLRAYSERYI
ncbi:hypothetical protein ACHAW5_004101 [Stephanodiscus triporus]|uniref:protein-tyrosine-phosphatase n=1 Tax=Stephanodiscus triporus TaxID=2934178 RepID=A0ABD3NEV9_9STRA